MARPHLLRTSAPASMMGRTSIAISCSTCRPTHSIARTKVRRAIASSPKSRTFASTSTSPSASSPTLTSNSSARASGSSSSSSSFSTVNASEISHFSRLSSQWWDTSGEFGLLHRMNPARVEYIRQKVCFPSIPVDRDRGHDRLPTLGSASTPDLAPGESSRSTAADSANQVSSFFSFLAGSGSSGSRPSLSPAINAKSTDGEPEWTFETRHADVERSRSAGTGNWLAGKRIVDVGCGGGLLSESLARLGGNVIGVDASEANINIARIHAARDPFLPYVGDEMGATSPQTSGMPSRHRGGGSLEYRCTSAESLRDAGEKFDLVCSMEVLEHVDQPGEFLKCLGDMVKPGGHLLLSTISRTPLSRLLTLTLAETVLRLVTPGTHTYNKFVKPHELRQFVYTDMGGHDVWEQAADASDMRKGEVGETRGIVYDPLRGGWLIWGGAEGTLGKQVGEGCNYMFHARKRADAA